MKKRPYTRLPPDQILARQLRHVAERRIGCLFAAVAAKAPVKYGWIHDFAAVSAEQIDNSLSRAIDDPSVSTLSLLFPSVRTTEHLLDLLAELDRCKLVFLESSDEFEGNKCFAYRARVGTLFSYVTGFGDFKFLPKTRQTPYVELTMRVKPRPAYDFVFKEAPPNVVHLADLDMLGLKRERLWGLWNGSFAQTKSVLGDSPDLSSAAKTTYSIPMTLLAAGP